MHNDNRVSAGTRLCLLLTYLCEILPATSETFDGWSAHPEIGGGEAGGEHGGLGESSGEHGDGSEGGGG